MGDIEGESDRNESSSIKVLATAQTCPECISGLRDRRLCDCIEGGSPDDSGSKPLKYVLFAQTHRLDQKGRLAQQVDA